MLLPLGLCVGLIGSITGVGGGFLIVPFLLLHLLRRRGYRNGCLGPLAGRFIRTRNRYYAALRTTNRYPTLHYLPGHGASHH